MDAFVLVEREDDLAVAARLEVVSSGILFTDLAVVVDFPVDGQYLFTVGKRGCPPLCGSTMERRSWHKMAVLPQ